MPYFSIIVPVYNAQNFIWRCAKSIQNQTVNDYEVIFIDDSSLDSSSEICKEIASEDKRFKYIRKIHEGASAARNCGIAEAMGKYIVFVDADDYLADRFLEKLLDTLSSGESPELCFMNCHYVDTGKEILKNKLFEIPEKLDGSKNISGKDFLDIVTHGTNRLPGSTWLIVAERDFLIKNKLQFNEKLIWSEDSDFIYRAMITADKIKCHGYCGYYYFMGNNNSISKTFSLPKAMGRMDVYSKWAVYFKSDNEAQKKYSKIAREKVVQQMLAEYCEILNVCINIKNKQEKKCLYSRLYKERKLWKQCRNYKYKDYVKYGIVGGTLLQRIKRCIKYKMKHKV